MANSSRQAAEKLIWSAAASAARRRFGFADHQNAKKSKAPPLSAHSKFVARNIQYEFFSNLLGPWCSLKSGTRTPAKTRARCACHIKLHHYQERTFLSLRSQ